MSNYITLFSCLLAGLLFKKSKLLPGNFYLGLNKLLIYFFIPVLTLYYLPELQFSPHHFWLLLTPWIVYAGAVVFFYIQHTIRPMDKPVLAALIMTSGISSISFVGFPLFELFYGAEGLSYGIILSLGGTFVVCNSIGIVTGFWFKDEKTSISGLIKGIFTFPPFIAMLFSLGLMLMDYTHPPVLKTVLKNLSSPFSVLALFTIGLQTATKGLKRYKKYFALGQAYKLVVAPLLIYIVFFIVNEHHTLIAKICILGAGMGSMNTIAIVAADLGLRPKLALLMPGLGIPVSILTVFIIHYILHL